MVEEKKSVIAMRDMRRQLHIISANSDQQLGRQIHKLPKKKC